MRDREARDDISILCIAREKQEARITQLEARLRVLTEAFDELFDIKKRDRLWLETQDNQNDGSNFGLTRRQARSLGTQLIAWANR